MVGRHERYDRRRSTFKSGSRGSRRAVFIGINYENDPQLQLSGCINDVHNAQKYLAQAGFVPDEVRVLTDRTQNDLPTRKNIIDAMQWLVDGSEAGDVLWLHFSGHGEQVRDASGDETDGKDEAIVPIDARSQGLIADDVINSCLVEGLPEGVTLYTVFDCCHSGTVMDLPYIYDELAGKMRRTGHDDLTDGGDVFMFSGCLNEQKSADLPADIFKGVKKSVGALSRALYKKLNDGYTWDALVREIRVGLKASKLAQVPQFETNTEINLNDMAFSKALGRSRKAGRDSNVPPATSAGDVPIDVLEGYEAKGQHVSGMEKYLNFSRQKAKTFSAMFSAKYRGTRDWLRNAFAKKAEPAPASRSASKGKKAAEASSSSSSGDYEDEDYYYSDDY